MTSQRLRMPGHPRLSKFILRDHWDVRQVHKTSLLCRHHHNHRRRRRRRRRHYYGRSCVCMESHYISLVFVLCLFRAPSWEVAGWIDSTKHCHMFGIEPDLKMDVQNLGIYLTYSQKLLGGYDDFATYA